MKTEELKAMLSDPSKIEFVQLTFDELVNPYFKREDIKGVVNIENKIVIEYGEAELPLKSVELLDMLTNCEDNEVGVMVEVDGKKEFRGIEDVWYIGGLYMGQTIIKIK